jgi:hypothetical protein
MLNDSGIRRAAGCMLVVSQLAKSPARCSLTIAADYGDIVRSNILMVIVRRQEATPHILFLK